MKKLLGIIVVVIIVAGIAALLLAHKANAPAASSQNQSSGPSSQSGSPSQSTNAVTIKSFAFSPTTLTVKKGTTVTWTNQDSVQHSVIADSSDAAGGPNGPLIGQNGTYSFTFNTVGTFAYHCGVHPDMKATVTVTE